MLRHLNSSLGDLFKDVVVKQPFTGAAPNGAYLQSANVSFPSGYKIFNYKIMCNNGYIRFAPIKDYIGSTSGTIDFYLINNGSQAVSDEYILHVTFIKDKE